MRTKSVIEQATAKSRRAVALALACGAVVVCALLAERAFYQSAQFDARRRLAAAERQTALITLADERLTMSAYLAVTTGEERWLERYEENTPVIVDAIRAASALAPPGVGATFDDQTQDANSVLVGLERSAFAAARVGDLAGARALLDSDDYIANKAILNSSSDALRDGVIGGVEAAVAQRDLRGGAALFAILALSAVGTALLWRRLSRGFAHNEAALSEAETRIRQLADTDMLTGLANRRAFIEEVRASVDRMQTDGGRLAALMVDLDRFKPINDRYGHLVGDLVLKEVSERLQNALRGGDFAARIGGDEFVILAEMAEGEAGEDDIRRLAERIIKAVSNPIIVDGLTASLGASAGIACFPSHTRQPQELLRMADVALYRAKAEGRGRAVVYDRIMDVDVEMRAQLEEALVLAIRAGEIVPHFQPLVDLSSGRTVAFEVLSRWEHPERGLLEPAEFIPMMEHFGLMNDLTFSVLKSACLAAREMPQNVRIAVNIAPQQIEDEWLAEKIMGVLTTTGFPASRLEIELTETALVNDLAAAKQVITSLKNLGVSVALDDFGTGYSSLCYLSELHFDKIKIDRSFVSSMLKRPESAKIVSAIVGLGRNLGATVVAEGVEDPTEAEVLRELGCWAAQGWLYAKAMPADEAAARVAAEAEPQADHAEMLRARSA